MHTLAASILKDVITTARPAIITVIGAEDLHRPSLGELPKKPMVATTFTIPTARLRGRLVRLRSGLDRLVTELVLIGTAMG
jgi:hypothetical protein